MYWRLKYFIILKYNELFKKNFLKRISIDVSKNNNFFSFAPFYEFPKLRPISVTCLRHLFYFLSTSSAFSAVQLWTWVLLTFVINCVSVHYADLKYLCSE